MTRYGYLHQPDPRVGTMPLSSDELKYAVKNLQHVRGLKESGSLQDPDTAALVDGKRCAVPDFGPADNARRKRRYATHGTVWNKTVSEHIALSSQTKYFDYNANTNISIGQNPFTVVNAPLHPV